ncbi:MAG TPA: OB-fold domain-containing protein [Ilumatobacteraceae bacterium]|nr:OB-fold domain-containing protein [Ilumatobacteraceae bacterium]
MTEQIPFVEYLHLGERPHLVASECTSCGARFFDRSNACASCFGTEFRPVDIATDGIVTAFTIVALAAPGVAVPFVSAIVDCDGTSVRANLTNVDPTPEAVTLGMPVRLTTVPVGADTNGVEAINFAFEPA